jgi:hypothetical protein
MNAPHTTGSVLRSPVGAREAVHGQAGSPDPARADIESLESRCINKNTGTSLLSPVSKRGPSSYCINERGSAGSGEAGLGALDPA